MELASDSSSQCRHVSVTNDELFVGGDRCWELRSPWGVSASKGNRNSVMDEAGTCWCSCWCQRRAYRCSPCLTYIHPPVHSSCLIILLYGEFMHVLLSVCLVICFHSRFLSLSARLSVCPIFFCLSVCLCLHLFIRLFPQPIEYKHF